MDLNVQRVFQDRAISRGSFAEMHEDYVEMLLGLVDSEKNFDTGVGFSSGESLTLRVKAEGAFIFVEVCEEVNFEDFHKYIYDALKDDFRAGELPGEVLGWLEDCLMDNKEFTDVSACYFVKRDSSFDDVMKVVGSLEEEVHENLEKQKKVFADMVRDDVKDKVAGCGHLKDSECDIDSLDCKIRDAVAFLPQINSNAELIEKDIEISF